jgi:diphthamide biosynthesis methyltransferase
MAMTIIQSPEVKQPQAQVQFLKNNTNPNNQLLILALHLQRTISLLARVDNYVFFTKEQNLVLNLNVIRNYRSQIHNILYLDLNKESNLKPYKTYKIMSLERSHEFMLNKELFFKTYCAETDLKFLNSLPFNIQKMLMDNITVNLNLGKQNR